VRKKPLANDYQHGGFHPCRATEYLDTHPDDTVAISYFNHYSKIKTKMCMEFSQKYYPLMKDYADSSKRFRWLDAPMCYEGGC